MVSRAFALIFITLSIPAVALAALPRPAPLAPAQRELVRARLAGVLDELELMKKNERSHRLDVRRQEREFGYLRVFERIPLSKDLRGLKRQLSESARELGLTVLSLSVTTPPAQKTRALPAQVRSDQPRFDLSPEDVVGELRFELQVRSRESAAPGALPKALNEWLRRWQESTPALVRYAQPTRPPVFRKGLWTLAGRSFYFRDIRFPKILTPDPLHAVPAWVREHREDFARAEPALAAQLTRAERLRKDSEPWFEVRGRFFLNAARMRAYLSKTSQN